MARHVAKVRVKYHRSPWSGLAQILHWLVVLVVIVALVVGGSKYLGRTRSAGALEYTSHIIGVDTSAVGVLDIAAADIDDDGDIDVITAGKDGLKVYEQQDDSTFVVKLIDDKDFERVQIIDLNKDGSLDLLTTLTDRQPSVRWYRNDGNLEFSGTAIGTGTDGVAYAGDIDADGAPDIVTATTQGGLIVLERWMNDGTGLFTSTQLSADSGVTSIAIGDMSGNGYPDIVTGGSKGVQRWGTSDGYTFSRLDIDDSNTGQQHLVVADVNQDGKMDVVAAEPGGDEIVYYRNQDQRAWQRIDLTTNTDATTVRVVDLDEDGDEDIVAAAQDDNSIVWMDNDGSDSFTKRVIAQGLQSIFSVAVIDLDNDNDFDVLGSNHYRGTVYWYERILAKPVATVPSSISQSTDGNGIVTFTTKISDADYDETRLRVQYSTDGVNWYKPWLTRVTPSAGSVSLKNSAGYQVGTSNGIDTDDNESVSLTLQWDTKSVENTGGPITGELSTVQLRVIPRDDVGNGDTQTSDQFTVDNQAPIMTSAKIEQMLADSAILSWNKVIDSNSFTLKVQYGTDAAAVLSEDSEVWDQNDDPDLSDVEVVGTTITGLLPDTFYAFKVFATDEYGNQTSLPSMQGTTVTTGASPSPGATVQPSTGPGITPTVTPPVATPMVSPSPSTTPGVSPPAVEPSPEPPTDNLPPVANAGVDLVVNKDALVILDGTASKDPEGASLTYSWRQVVGPEVELSSSNTATPSFTASQEDASYVFALTVRDIGGLVSTDSVTVVTRPVLEKVTKVPSGPTNIEVEKIPLIVTTLLAPANVILLIIAIILMVVGTRSKAALNFIKMLAGLMKGWHKTKKGSGVHLLKVVEGQNGKGIAGVKLVIKSMDGRVWGKYHTDDKGQVRLTMAVGQYVIEIGEKGYSFVPASPSALTAKTDIVYGGGKLQVKSQEDPMTVVLPVKRSSEEINSLYGGILRVWQLIQHRGHMLAWPVLIVGSGLNTTLLLWVPQMSFLLIEVIYVVLVVIKVWMDVRQTPSYGLVRDAISHVPLDLAVIRLYEEGTNRLVMTRATNAQGKFFALPPPGKYTMTVSKPGYATYTKHNVTITKEQGTVVQMQTDLMPVIPKAKPLMVGGA